MGQRPLSSQASQPTPNEGETGDQDQCHQKPHYDPNLIHQFGDEDENLNVNPVIGFLDVDAYECQLWQRENPRTRGKPCIVANMCGRICAVSYEAKALGVNRRDTPSVSLAIKKCPKIHVFRKPDKWGKQDQAKIRRGTWEVVTAILDFLNTIDAGSDVKVEVASSDEIYIDLTSEVSRGLENLRETKRLLHIRKGIIWERTKQKKVGPFLFKPFRPQRQRKRVSDSSSDSCTESWHHYNHKAEERLVYGAVIMHELCSYVESRTRLSCSGGVGPNKLLAKIGCGVNKPRKITVFPEWAIVRLSKEISISNIPGLGGNLGEEIKQKFNIRTMYELRGIDYDTLEAEFGTETAQRITSLGQGKDISPVVSRITRDQIRRNKPHYDIKSLITLNLVLHNLAEEMGVLLREEKVRYHRTTCEIRIEYMFKSSGRDNNNEETEHETSGNGIFEISEGKPALCILAENILQYFRHLPTFNESAFKITKLAFVLSNFVSLGYGPLQPEGSPSSNVLSTSFESLNTSFSWFGCPPISIKVRQRHPPESFLRFEHKVVGRFRIDSELQYNVESLALPKLVSTQEIEALQGYKLMKDYPDDETLLMAKLISDYYAYDQHKHMYFSRWLNENWSRIEVEGVHFISFQSRIYDLLKTPCNRVHGHWSMYAMRVGNTIQLWDEKGLSPAEMTIKAPQYMGSLFEKLLTTPGGKKRTDLVINELDKVFVVQKVNLGRHVMLLLTHVDAEDHESEDFVQVSVTTEDKFLRRQSTSFKSQRIVKRWAQAEVSGSKKIVVGGKRHTGTITQMEVLSLEELRSQVSEEKIQECFHFQERLLHWIKEHFLESNHLLVKRFSWIPGYPNKVMCNILPQKEVAKLTVPKIYFKEF